MECWTVPNIFQRIPNFKKKKVHVTQDYDIYDSLLFSRLTEKKKKDYQILFTKYCIQNNISFFGKMKTETEMYKACNCFRWFFFQFYKLDLKIIFFYFYSEIRSLKPMMGSLLLKNVFIKIFKGSIE